MLRDRILAYFKPTIEREKRHRLAFAGIVSFTLLGMMAASAITPTDMPAPSIEFQDIVERLTLANMNPIDTGSGNDFFHEERIQPSDSVASLLKRLSISDPEVFEFILKNQKTQAVARQMRPGKTIAAQTGALGEFKALYFPLSGKDNVLAVRKNGNSFEADEQTLVPESYLTLKAGEIRNSLFGATDAVGIPDAIAIQIAEIFGGVIDFHRDLRKGDRFFVAYETLARTGGSGNSVRAGRVLAVEFINNQKTYTAFLFKTADGKEGYYSADGASLRRAFLRSPLEFSRVTSGFSTSRFHPVLKIWRSHKGVDYAAPTGTRILSVSDGRIEFVGRQNGYGNLIIVKHRGVFSTAYAHLSGFAPGIKKGVSVSQGEVIGYVGQTGLATGPHLHYEFRVNSVQVNPLAIALPEAVPLEAAEIERFMTLSAPQKTQIVLAKEIQPAPYTLE